jgi:hypothetical protein
MRLFQFQLLSIVLACAGAQAGIVNGDFQTGNLTGWSVFTTPNGTNGTCPGSVPCPAVTSFDTTGSGASDAAEFNAGQVTFQFGIPAGGGLVQSVFFPAGMLSVSMDWAAIDEGAFGNADGGVFSILLNGATIASFDSSTLAANTTSRGTLSGSTTISAPGMYQFAVEVTRPFQPDPNVFQYVDNVTASIATPEPGTLGLAIAGISLAGIRRRRQSRRRH